VFLVFYLSPKLALIWNIFLIIFGIFIALAPKIIFGIPHYYEFSKAERNSQYSKINR
jgi:hypothetical protein